MSKNEKVVLILSCVIILLIAVMTIYAIILEDGGQPYWIETIRGDEAQIYGGNGIYAYDTVENALMCRAFDWFFLIIGVPALILAIISYLKKSAMGFLILVSLFFLSIYNYIINSIGIAFNRYFLLYMMVYIFSFYALIILIRSRSLQEIKQRILPNLPTKTISIYLFIVAAYFLVDWLNIDCSVLFSGATHPGLAVYTTPGTNVTDLSIFVPIAISSSVMLLREKPLGGILAVGLTILIFFEMVALNIYMIMQVTYFNESISSIEWPLVALVPISVTMAIFALKKLRKVKLET